MYLVINRRTGQTVARCSTRQRASRKVDTLDNAWGAYVHYIKEDAQPRAQYTAAAQVKA